jgi:hypothetical protein
MPLTYFLAQLIGLYCLLIGCALLFRKKMMVEVINDMYRNPSVLFVVGLIATFLGLLVVLNHNYWNSGFLALVVTLVGWAALLKGGVILFVPEMTVSWVRMARLEKFAYVYAVIVLIVGLYLVHGGFTQMGLLH